MSRQAEVIGSASGRAPTRAFSTGGASLVDGTGAPPPGGGLEHGQQQVAAALEAVQDARNSGRPGGAAGERGATPQASRPPAAAVLLAEGAGTSAAGLSQSLAAAATEAAAAAAAVDDSPEPPQRQPATGAAMWGARARYLLLLCRRLLLQQLLLLPERRSWQLDPLLRFRPGMPVPAPEGWGQEEPEELEGGLEAQFEQYHAAMMANKVRCACCPPAVRWWAGSRHRQAGCLGRAAGVHGRSGLRGSSGRAAHAMPPHPHDGPRPLRADGCGGRAHPAVHPHPACQGPGGRHACGAPALPGHDCRAGAAAADAGARPAAHLVGVAPLLVAVPCGGTCVRVHGASAHGDGYCLHARSLAVAASHAAVLCLSTVPRASAGMCGGASSCCTSSFWRRC